MGQFLTDLQPMKNDYVNLDVTKAKDSTALTAVVIYAAKTKLQASHVLNIYAQRRNLRGQQVPIVTDNCRQDPSDQTSRFTMSCMMRSKVRRTRGRVPI